MKSDEEALSRSRAGSIKSSAPPPLPRRGSPAPAKLSSSPNSINPHSTLPLTGRREPPAPPNGKHATSSSATMSTTTQDTFKPSSSTIDEIQRRRKMSSPTKPDTSSGQMPPPVVPRSRMPMSVETDSPPPEGLISPVQPDQKAPAPSLPARKATLPSSTSAPADSRTTPAVVSRKPAPIFPNGPAQPSKPGTTQVAPVPASPRTQKAGSVADRLKQWEQIGAQPPTPPRVTVPRSPTKPSSGLPPSPTKRASEDGTKARHAPPTKPVKAETLRKVSNTNGSSPPKP